MDEQRFKDCIDNIWREWERELIDMSNLYYSDNPFVKLINDNGTHTHKWLKYQGLTDTYDYCECGEKKK